MMLGLNGLNYDYAVTITSWFFFLYHDNAHV